MNQSNKWFLIVLTLCGFSQISFANTSEFQQKLDDFAWSLGSQNEQGLSPALFEDIHTFTKEHHQDYQKARAESLKKWQASKIDTSGFLQLKSDALDAYSQELSQASPPSSNEYFAMPKYWKILSVQSMTNMIASRAWPLLREPPLDFSMTKISSLSSINYLFGTRYATIPLENDVWEIWAYSHTLAYKYKWDTKQDQIKDFSVWLKDEYLR